MRSLRPLIYTAAALCGVALCAAALFWGSFAYFKSQELAKAEARLTLYRSTVASAMQHFAHMPFLLSLDPFVIQTLRGGDTEILNARFARMAQSAGIDAIYLMDQDGLTIAASNARAPHSFVGQNYAFRPYFQQAMQGQLGEFYGIGATTGVPGYFYATEVRAPQGQPRGVVAIKLDLAELQDSWQGSGERIMLSNADGVVLLASNPDWRYRTLAALRPDQRGKIEASRQFAGEPLAALDWAPDPASRNAVIDGERFLYLSTQNLPNAWSLHFFAPDDAAVTQAWLTTTGLAVLSGFLLIAWQVRRVQQIGAALRRSEHEEAQLRQANERLAVEIEERRAAERSLQKTQAELERAGRLAALGQLASSVTHELGQPIAAMRNQLAAEEISAGASLFSGKMQGLVARMEDITRQLKFFSRKGRDQFEPVDLADVTRAALELLAPNIEVIRAEIAFRPPEGAVMLYGNKMRLEQVVTNLVRNALDAVEASPQRKIRVDLGTAGPGVWFEVSDTGHGLGGRSFDDLREPFATTRESGKGMGLGLTISAGIVSDHGGALSARDRAAGGAVFRAEFPAPHTSEGAA